MSVRRCRKVLDNKQMPQNPLNRPLDLSASRRRRRCRRADSVLANLTAAASHLAQRWRRMAAIGRPDAALAAPWRGIAKALAMRSGLCSVLISVRVHAAGSGVGTRLFEPRRRSHCPQCGRTGRSHGSPRGMKVTPSCSAPRLHVDAQSNDQRVEGASTAATRGHALRSRRPILFNGSTSAVNVNVNDCFRESLVTRTISSEPHQANHFVRCSRSPTRATARTPARLARVADRRARPAAAGEPVHGLERLLGRADLDEQPGEASALVLEEAGAHEADPHERARRRLVRPSRYSRQLRPRSSPPVQRGHVSTGSGMAVLAA